MNGKLAKSQRLRLANATVQPAGASDPNIWHAVHFRNGASSRGALDNIDQTSSPIDRSPCLRAIDQWDNP
jgi:hypothetical protein